MHASKAAVEECLVPAPRHTRRGPEPLPKGRLHAVEHCMNRQAAPSGRASKGELRIGD